MTQIRLKVWHDFDIPFFQQGGKCSKLIIKHVLMWHFKRALTPETGLWHSSSKPSWTTIIHVREHTSHCINISTSLFNKLGSIMFLFNNRCEIFELTDIISNQSALIWMKGQATQCCNWLKTEKMSWIFLPVILQLKTLRAPGSSVWTKMWLRAAGGKISVRMWSVIQELHPHYCRHSDCAENVQLLHAGILGVLFSWS